MTPAYIALGSNLQDPLAQLQLAAAALKALPGTQFKRGSSVYRSPAVGPGTQPDYLNAVALITTLWLLLGHVQLSQKNKLHSQLS